EPGMDGCKIRPDMSMLAQVTVQPGELPRCRVGPGMGVGQQVREIGVVLLCRRVPGMRSTVLRGMGQFGQVSPERAGEIVISGASSRCSQWRGVGATSIELQELDIGVLLGEAKLAQLARDV